MISQQPRDKNGGGNVAFALLSEMVGYNYRQGGMEEYKWHYGEGE